MHAVPRANQRPVASARRLAAFLSGAAVCTGALLIAACGADSAGDGSDDGRPDAGGSIAELHIVVRHPTLEQEVEYDIGCLGDTFPVTPPVEGVDGEVGCGLLADEAIRSRLIDGLPEDLACTMIYGGPDEAEITGTIDSESVNTTITRANGCEIASWDSMVGLIPPPIGVTD